MVRGTRPASINKAASAVSKRATPALISESWQAADGGWCCRGWGRHTRSEKCLPDESPIYQSKAFASRFPQRAGSEIPLVYRIVCVIDAYDAMISHRCYRKGLGHEEAARRLRAAAGTQFDAGVVQVFLPIAEAEASEVFAAAGTSTGAIL